MKLSPTSFSTTLRERRKTLGLSQTDLAQLAGVSLHTLINIETGKGNPTLQVMSKMLEVLGLELQVQVRSLESQSMQS
ncbi:MAG: helix-turn-helix transcriptional regulator [Fibrobacteres bacterium]|jgi:y4mF family transcriptional regulator|nr:helix-turn-helix transcriptional regulator [Fibrobacterota bacterium]